MAGDGLGAGAVLRNVAIIGETTEGVRAKMPGFEAKKIAEMRGRLSHVYHAVDPDIVREVVETTIPDLLQGGRGVRREVRRVRGFSPSRDPGSRARARLGREGGTGRWFSTTPDCIIDTYELS